MILFLKKIALLILPIIGFFILVLFMPSPKAYKSKMVFAQIDKNKLLATVASPRIIFVGGSNLSFGLNSQLIKDSLHLNPINTAIHAEVGLRYMMANVINKIKPNDKVILVPEYQQFYGDFANGGRELLMVAMDVSPETRKLLNLKQWQGLIKTVPEYTLSKLSGFLGARIGADNLFRRNIFNGYGDAEVHWKLKGKIFSPYSRIEGNMNEKILQDIIAFRDSIISRKASLYVSYPGYQYTSYQKSVDKITAVDTKLRSLGLNVISIPRDYEMPDSVMFDTPYHLIKQGVDRRTELLIGDLKKALQK